MPLFKKNLSAFLSASRSVLQFALEEACQKSGGQAWYDAAVSSDPLIAFLKDKRDANIHRTPVTVAKDVRIELSAPLRLTASLSMTVMGPDGKVKDSYMSEPEAPKKQEWVPPKTSYRYRFDDWHGEEHVPTLAQRYLGTLKSIVEDGRQQGFLS